MKFEDNELIFHVERDRYFYWNTQYHPLILAPGALIRVSEMTYLEKIIYNFNDFAHLAIKNL